MDDAAGFSRDFKKSPMASRFAAWATATLGRTKSVSSDKHRAVAGRRSTDMDASVGLTR
jgi:hypothetical protein